MKKLLWSILCSFLIAACCKDHKETENIGLGTDTIEVATPINIKDFIEGEWVADYAIEDPKGYRWEILKFQESGIMYFSNYSDNSAKSHVYVNGTYTIDGNVIKTNCELGWTNLYYTYNAELHVTQIDEYTLKADIFVGGQIIETNTYIKVIEKIELSNGIINPDYVKLLSGKKIIGFRSHNNYIATVDENTGEIKSEWSGSTYIDVITDKGTAALEVNINNILYFDYEDYVGATLKDIVKVFNRQNATEDNVLIYNYNENFYPSLQQKSGNWRSMGIRLNSTSGYVDNISLIAKDDVWFTEYQISDFLSDRYTMYQRDSSYNDSMGIPPSEYYKVKEYYIGNSLQEAKVGVTWNSESKILSFVDLKDEHRNTVDYGHFMLMTADEIRIIMGEPDYSRSDEWMAYRIGGKYANVIKFSFKNRDSNKIKKKVQEIDVFLYNDADINTPVSELDEKYEFENEMADTRVYNCSSPQMLVDIWLGNNTTTKLIQYVYHGLDLETDEGYLWPEYASLVLNNVTDIKAAMGEPVETITDQIVFRTYQFMGVFWYYDIKGNDHIKRVAVNRNLRWINATNFAVFLKDNINSSDITSYLGRLYSYQEKESDTEAGVYVYKTTIRYIDIWIEYDSTNGVVYYFRK